MIKYPYFGEDDLAENKIYKEFDLKADRFVAEKLKDYKTAPIDDIKVIHDPVWGTIKFYPWELQVLDSPLVQRLRNINQLGLAVYTYPSAHHSRFEHTLGVTALVSRMVDSINDKVDEEAAIGKSDRFKLRMAAILHDVGHCFFSHLSERMFGSTDEFTELKNSFEVFKKAQPHEILGYVIINTKSFKKFFCSSVNYPEKTDNLFFEDLGRMIVGAPIDRDFHDNKGAFKKYYLTEMINGQFDADSLDYLRRDSYITGLSLTYHIDRFLYKIKLVDREENGVVGKHLTVAASGVSTVEEMVFGKQMLTRYIYQHQKVLATDALVYDVVSGLRFGGKLLHPSDFLYFTDDDIMKLCSENGDSDFTVPISKLPIHKDSKKTVFDAVKQIKNRTLPKKALIINMGNIKSLNGKTDFDVNEAYEFLKTATADGFRHDIMEEAVKICRQRGLDRSKIDLYDIYYSVPKPITTKNYTDVYVADGKGFVELSEVADLNDWADEFSGRAWNAYVFTSSEMLPIVSLAAKNVLENRGIEFVKEKVFSGLKFAVE